MNGSIDYLRRKVARSLPPFRRPDARRPTIAHKVIAHPSQPGRNAFACLLLSVDMYVAHGMRGTMPLRVAKEHKGYACKIAGKGLSLQGSTARGAGFNPKGASTCRYPCCWERTYGGRRALGAGAAHAVTKLLSERIAGPEQAGNICTDDDLEAGIAVTAILMGARIRPPVQTM